MKVGEPACRVKSLVLNNSHSYKRLMGGGPFNLVELASFILTFHICSVSKYRRWRDRETS
ncbi:hypothetical protein P5673_003141 [Acropora cervicornis]|uniref:Uncharacterized protein n=1 Tax=Acropora cervicornis TaxID=6130 RepID=A0AAD9R262_ACRCE|nr:hypothetical protein P5673_003141 [Acropora cervicornis]